MSPQSLKGLVSRLWHYWEKMELRRRKLGHWWHAIDVLLTGIIIGPQPLSLSLILSWLSWGKPRFLPCIHSPWCLMLPQAQRQQGLITMDWNLLSQNKSFFLLSLLFQLFYYYRRLTNTMMESPFTVFSKNCLLAIDYYVVEF
jgi:hypothetical protein